MYAYIEGKFVLKTPTTVYVDNGGVAFLINISVHTFSKIESLDQGRLYTHLYVKEDVLSLYGFFDEEEKELFRQLISVSGIGPNTARIVLSSMTPSEVGTAIALENDTAFKKVKGVGPKTAKRIILDLKDKVRRPVEDQKVQKQDGGRLDQAAIALVALGFQRQKVNKTLDKINYNETMSTEEIIKMALQHLT